MPYVPTNPYISLEEVVEELKNKQADVEANAELQDELLRAIERASRWVDDYLRRDFFFHDHRSVPIEIDQFSPNVFRDILFLPHTPVLSITEVKFGESVLVSGTDWTYDSTTLRGITTRWTPSRPGNIVFVKGTFGYPQNSFFPVTEEGDDSNQLANWELDGISEDEELWWRLEDQGAGVARVRLFSDSGFANLVAEGTGANTGTVTVTLSEEGGSGISGTVEMTYSVDDVDSANRLIGLAPVVDHTQIPSGIPGRITMATRLVAAAISGHNRKEIVSLEGSKIQIATTEIPKTVFDLLGKRMPILI